MPHVEKLSPNDKPVENAWDALMDQKSGNSLGINELKPDVGTLIRHYGDRIIYTDESGQETRIELNPWAMEESATESPENMLILGQALQHMAKKWHHDERNPGADQGETGWDNAYRVDSSSMLGQYIEQVSHPDSEKSTGNSLDINDLAPSYSALMENYGQRVIYTDKNGKETQMTLNPLAMMESAMDSPEDMLNTGIAFFKMANRWHNDDRNPRRKIYADGKETGWDDALRVTDDSTLGRYVSKEVRKIENAFADSGESEFI